MDSNRVLVGVTALAAVAAVLGAAAVPAFAALSERPYRVVDATCPVYFDDVLMASEADRAKVDEAYDRYGGLSESHVSVDGVPTLVYWTPIWDPTIPQPTPQQLAWVQDPDSDQFGSDPRDWHRLCWGQS